MAGASRSSLILKQISQELRHALGKESLAKNDAMRYMLLEARRHDVTDERVCRPANEMQFMAETYLSYLNSGRLYQQLYEEYHGKGDVTTEQAANRVGLRLPKKYSEK